MAWDFNIDFTYQVNAVIRRLKRKPMRIGWLLVIVNPLKNIHADFLIYREKINREMRYNAQVMMLEAALNKEFYGERFWASAAEPTAQGHIWINNTGYAVPSNFIYYDSENQQPLYTYYDSEMQPPLTTNYDSEYSANYNYIVNVPVALTFNQNYMRAFIDKVNLAGMKYIIQTY